MELVKSLKQSKLLKYVFFALIGSIILAISSKIKIPFYPVPMTMQTLVILLIGACFGWRLGVATISLYLFEGIIGMPVFSGTPEKGIGIVYFTGPTMGYLIGFIVAGFLAGKFIYDNSYIKTFLKLTFATSFIYILGMLWLGTLIGWDKPIFKLGAQPFLLAELFKIMIATLAINHIKKLRKYIRKEIQTLHEQKSYPVPLELLDVMKDELEMRPLKRYVNNIKAVNSIPPSYKIFLHNGQDFDIIYLGDQLNNFKIKKLFKKKRFKGS